MPAPKAPNYPSNIKGIPPSPTEHPPIEHGPVKGPESPPGKVISEPVIPPGKEHGPVSGGGSKSGSTIPPGAINEWEEIIKREIEHKSPPIWLPMMGGSLAPAPGAHVVAPGTNQQGLAIKLP
jgi:hypothetical protein